jgi:hypothetical protein
VISLLGDKSIPGTAYRFIPLITVSRVTNKGDDAIRVPQVAYFSHIFQSRLYIFIKYFLSMESTRGFDNYHLSNFSLDRCIE